jgi:hypothetical protein
VRCMTPISPFPASWTFDTSKTGAPSTALGPAPGNCTETFFEVEFKTIEAISNDGENSTVAIWKRPVTWTDACPCCDGVIWTAPLSAPDRSWRPATLKAGELITPGRCCCYGVRRIMPIALPLSWMVEISNVT